MAPSRDGAALSGTHFPSNRDSAAPGCTQRSSAPAGTQWGQHSPQWQPAGTVQPQVPPSKDGADLGASQQGQHSPGWHPAAMMQPWVAPGRAGAAVGGTQQRQHSLGWHPAGMVQPWVTGASPRATTFPPLPDLPATTFSTGHSTATCQSPKQTLAPVWLFVLGAWRRGWPGGVTLGADPGSCSGNSSPGKSHPTTAPGRAKDPPAQDTAPCRLVASTWGTCRGPGDGHRAGAWDGMGWSLGTSGKGRELELATSARGRKLRLEMSGWVSGAVSPDGHSPGQALPWAQSLPGKVQSVRFDLASSLFGFFFYPSASLTPRNK